MRLVLINWKGTDMKTLRALKLSGLVIALQMAGCGGGGDSTERAEILKSACQNGNASACGQGGDTAAPTALYTTAPAAVTLTAGEPVTYGISGGTKPYSAISSNANMVTASVSNSTLTINPIAVSEPTAGGGLTSANVSVTDAAGKAVQIAVTTLSTGQAAPLSVFPRVLTVGDCTTNIPFVFAGGTPPFTILTTDSLNVPVSAALPLGTNHFYMATIGPVGYNDEPIIHTLTVLDSQSRAAVTQITIPKELGHSTCPVNPLLQALPASANAHVSEILAFQLKGGVAPYSFSTSDANIARIVSSTATSFYAQAQSAGTVLLTVSSSDGQRSNITFTVIR